jgi:hypothetical protein
MTDEENPKWIPVSERMPEPYQSVLLWNPPFPQQYVGHWCPVEKWFNRSAGGLDTTPTHWMPLPAPPTDDE